MNQSIEAKILDLVSEGVISEEFVMRACLNWLSSDDVQDMVDNQPDWDGLGLGSDDEDEGEV